MLAPRFIRWFRALDADQVGLVGGKNASLGEMSRELTPRGIRVPIVTATAGGPKKPPRSGSS
jgi:pyruvate,water dikinase